MPKEKLIRIYGQQADNMEALAEVNHRSLPAQVAVALDEHLGQSHNQSLLKMQRQKNKH